MLEENARGTSWGPIFTGWVNAFKSGIFPKHSRPPNTSDDDFDITPTLEPQSTSSPIKPTQRKELKILPQKQLLQRLSTLLAQSQACNTSEHFFKKVREIVYSLYQEKQILY